MNLVVAGIYPADKNCDGSDLTNNGCQAGGSTATNQYRWFRAPENSLKFNGEVLDISGSCGNSDATALPGVVNAKCRVFPE
jgi:hypothetical protein